MAEAAAQSAIRRFLKARSFRPGTSSYEESLDSYNSALASEPKPALIVQPSSAQEVSELLKTLETLHHIGNFSIAVRDGGHTPWSGCSNVDEGTTIDLSRLRGVEFGAGKKTVKIAGGEKWEAVYGHLERHGLTAAEGRIGDVAPMPKAFFRHSSLFGGNVLGLAESDAPFFAVFIKTIWGEAKDDERVIAVNKALVDTIDEESAKRDLSLGYKFLSYAYEGQDVFGGYGAESLGRLREVSRRYDPAGFFQKGVPGGLKLW